MGDVQHEQIYQTSSVAVGADSTSSASMVLYSCPSGKVANIITMWMKVATSTGCHLEVFQDIASPTENKIWRKEDGFNPPGTTEFMIDFLTRYMNGVVLESSDDLSIKMSNTAATANTVSAGVWVSERSNA